MVKGQELIEGAGEEQGKGDRVLFNFYTLHYIEFLLLLLAGMLIIIFQ